MQKKAADMMDVVPDSQTGELLFAPYNSENCQITPKDVMQILSTYGLPPHIDNFELYRRAFIHRSYTTRPSVRNAPCPAGAIPISSKSNERLEFLGDGVLEVVAKHYIYSRFPKADEGVLTDIKGALVNNTALGNLVIEMGLNRWFVLSRSMETKNKRTADIPKLGCLFEAFLGALFLDMNKQSLSGHFSDFFTMGPGVQMAKVFIENVFATHVDWADILKNRNYKQTLQILLQKAFFITPEYLKLSSEGDGEYRMAVYLCLGCNIHHLSPTEAETPETPFTSIDALTQYVAQKGGKVFVKLGEGVNRKKKDAEMNACKFVLSHMGIDTHEE